MPNNGRQRQQAWMAAQPSLLSAKNHYQQFQHALPRILRVGKIDAELLDEELLQILLSPMTKALGLFNASYASYFEPECAFIIRSLLYKFSVWDLGATYGAKLQNLRYDAPASRKSSPSGISKKILWLHGVMTVLIPYLHRRLRIYALSRAWPDIPSNDIRRKIWEGLTRLETLHDALSLLSFVTFMCNGKYRTIADRFLCLQLVPFEGTTSKQVSYEFMNRQMVWHAFTEFLIFTLPLINTRLLRRRLSRVYIKGLSLTRRMLSFESPLLDRQEPQDNKYRFLPEDQCAICVENAGLSVSTSLQGIHSNSFRASQVNNDDYPLNTPYISSCLHKYCYVCIADRLLRAANDGETSWQCLRCGSAVLTADRLTIDSDQDSSIADLDDTFPENGEFLTAPESDA